MEKEVKPSQTESAGVMAQLSRRFDEVSGSGSHYGSSGAQQKPLLKKPDIRLLTYLPFKLANPQNYRRLNMF
ncbi:MAG: hypothetical protein ACI8XV_002121 [Arenicella sp.]|jgi:hypothetical protein